MRKLPGRRWFSLLFSVIAAVALLNYLSVQRVLKADWVERRPRFFMEKTSVSVVEHSVDEKVYYTLNIKFKVRNRGSMPADRFSFSSTVNDDRKSSYIAPDEIRQGQAANIFSKYTMTLDRTEPVLVKAYLKYSYGNDNFAQVFSFLCQPDKKIIEEISNSQTFVLDHAEIISDKTDVSNPSFRSAEVLFVFRNIQVFPVDGVVFVPFFQGSKLGEFQGPKGTIWPRETFTATGSYHWSGEESEPFDLKIQIRYRFGEKPQADEVTARYYPKEKFVETLITPTMNSGLAPDGHI